MAPGAPGRACSPPIPLCGTAKSLNRLSLTHFNLTGGIRCTKAMPIQEQAWRDIAFLLYWDRSMNGFTIEYVELPNGRMPAREFIDSLDDKAAGRVDAFIERLRIYGNRMEGKFVKKLTRDIFELRVKQFDRIFRILFFYQPGMLIVVTSGLQKKTQETPPSEIARAERLRKLWLRYRNRYPALENEREAIQKETGL